MIHRIWRLSETSAPNNLGLACTDQGLLLGRTPLIERRGGRFVVRERSDIECLFSLAYGRAATAQRLMPGLATVASALNANDQGLARIAAVHLRIPDLPDRAARDLMEAADVLIKYARDESGGSDWNPALHPRARTDPHPAASRPRMAGARNWPETMRRNRRCWAAEAEAAAVLDAATAATPASLPSRFGRAVAPIFTAFWCRTES